LRPRTVRDNIIGIATDLTLDDAWRAARLAAVDRDIRSMPMGMFTVITENSAVFSGGQVQRIMLAAALVRSPRVLLLDEATSWLDNNTQATVMRRIEELAVTRIVIAHRLSTIRNADRIYVLDEGRVAQQGTFAQLIETPGIFRDLANRQMT
ncbi:MAG: ATP-binding cassette domain-containing protein, partial [Acidobacteria bacterium]|nr:ATP-binding cassette domain-containing protein [Acidobacteriota bacterium]